MSLRTKNISKNFPERFRISDEQLPKAIREAHQTTLDFDTEDVKNCEGAAKIQVVEGKEAWGMDILLSACLKTNF